jgi:hypothetical protein
VARDVDPKRTRKALRIVRKLAAQAAPAPSDGESADASDGAASEAYSSWEKTFLDEVGARLEKYGSAFADPSKGRPDEALSNLQAAKLREIAAKASGKVKGGGLGDKPRRGLTTRKPLGARRAPRSAPERD